MPLPYPMMQEPPEKCEPLKEMYMQFNTIYGFDSLLHLLQVLCHGELGIGLALDLLNFNTWCHLGQGQRPGLSVNLKYAL